jgi:dihydrodipicolinate synthase/N-acetylneuraminate lyase
LALELDELMAASTLDISPVLIKCTTKLMGLIPSNEHRLPMMLATTDLENQVKAVVDRYQLAMRQTNVDDQTGAGRRPAGKRLRSRAR